MFSYINYIIALHNTLHQLQNSVETLYHRTAQPLNTAAICIVLVAMMKDDGALEAMGEKEMKTICREFFDQFDTDGTGLVLMRIFGY